MAFRGMSISTRLAIGAVLIIGGLSPANAQFGPRQSGPPYRPARDAKDLRAVLGLSPSARIARYTRKGTYPLRFGTKCGEDPSVV
jgi:hypothetical protein